MLLDMTDPEQGSLSKSEQMTADWQLPSTMGTSSFPDHGLWMFGNEVAIPETELESPQWDGAFDQIADLLFLEPEASVQHANVGSSALVFGLP